MNICVVGGGYVGLVTAAGLSHLGHQVNLVEIDPIRLAVLQRGQLPIYEPGLAEMVVAGTLAGSLTFGDDLEWATADAEVAMICVNTPASADGRVDTGHVDGAVSQLLEHGPDGLIVVMKSTVPVGTGDELRDQLAQSGRSFGYISNPEFLRKGSAVRDFLSPDRIVIGGYDAATIETAARIYESLDAPVFRVSTRAAELGQVRGERLPRESHLVHERSIATLRGDSRRHLRGRANRRF